MRVWVAVLVAAVLGGCATLPKTLVTMIATVTLLIGCSAPPSPAQDSDLRDNTDAELTALLPATSEFPAFITDSHSSGGNREPSESPPCKWDPWTMVSSNFTTVTSRISGSQNMQLQDAFSVGLYRDRDQGNGIELITNYLDRCPSVDYESDFGETIHLEYVRVDPPVVGPGQVVAYQKSRNSEITGTYYLAGLRGLIIDTFFGPQADAELAKRLFIATLDNVNNAT